MTGIFIAFIVLIIILVLLVCIIAFSVKGNNNEQDNSLYNEDGDHLYYDSSLIEKKDFAKRHPSIKDVRSFRRLFKEISHGK